MNTTFNLTALEAKYYINNTIYWQILLRAEIHDLNCSGQIFKSIISLDMFIQTTKDFSNAF